MWRSAGSCRSRCREDTRSRRGSMGCCEFSDVSCVGTFWDCVGSETMYRSRNSFRNINFIVSSNSIDTGICGKVWILLPFFRCTLSGFESNNATAGPRHSVILVSRSHCTGANRYHTQNHKHDIRSPIQLSQRPSAVVERQIDRAAEYAATVPICQPVRQVLPSVLRRWIA